MDAVTEPSGLTLMERARRVGAIAGDHADDVDRQGRFPREAVDAMIAERLLSIQVPVELGGEGATVTQIAQACTELGRACASAAMVFAMHHIKLSSLVMHGMDSAWHRGFMRAVVADQLLLASATTEGGIGGNLRNSICAIAVEGETCRLEKDATVISYGRHADAILITSRAHADAASGDQVMTVFLKDQYSLERTQGWDTLGMRGTCSEGYLFKGQAPSAQIIPKPFAEIAAQSMLATSHLLWAGVWYGIAVDAATRAQGFIRAAARKSPGQTPPGAAHLADASSLLLQVRSTVTAGLARFEAALADPEQLSSMGFAAAMNNVKIAVSRTVPEIIDHAMQITGILGYKNGTPFSLGRHLRDAQSAQLMISNDRILANTANMLLVNKIETGL